MKEKLTYLLSSGIAFVVDYFLLLFLDSLLPIASMEIGAFFAWCVSSLTNFFINRNIVFRSDVPLRKALPEYYGLAGVVFVLKTYVILEVLTRLCGIPLKYAKLIAEVIFFISNYIVQKTWIFGSHKNKG